MGAIIGIVLGGLIVTYISWRWIFWTNVGSTSLHGTVADAFTSGLHAAFYASIGSMALAAALSALRAGSYPETLV
jgi:MFS family permease